ncbi:MAG: hypothetical protein AB7S65_04055 [Sulfuricurvum sp.]
MRITYNSSTLNLEDLPLDIGYASEKVSLKNGAGSTFIAGGQNGGTQVIVTAPFADESFSSQLKELSDLLKLNALNGVSCIAAFADAATPLPEIEGWLSGYDVDEALGDYYGIRIADGEFGGKFAKALFIVSKDGALFHSEIVPDLNAPLSIDNAIVKIAAAENCYTGKGCH